MHCVSAAVARASQLLDESRFPHPRLADDLDEARFAGADRQQGLRRARPRSSARPTNGRASARRRRARFGAPSANAVTGRRFPFTLNGASASVSNASWERSSTSGVTSTWPGAAFDMTRAARFTVSPMTVNVRR